MLLPPGLLRPEVLNRSSEPRPRRGRRPLRLPERLVARLQRLDYPPPQRRRFVQTARPPARPARPARGQLHAPARPHVRPARPPRLSGTARHCHPRPAPATVSTRPPAHGRPDRHSSRRLLRRCLLLPAQLVRPPPQRLLPRAGHLGKLLQGLSSTRWIWFS